ncbi:hypothetical protein O6H91_04G061500 [Diphasiastrum complanatum]|uniref:Uncharacterized protein n=1 Tax=Diphasiastrum complanatum TaxID=34168 RepID=A0ACC2DXK4_DIPCM|nr:hypothetical protein O6H91_04G061500 [Diphasiastrum complanatum]
MARYQKEAIIFAAPLLLLNFAAYTVLLALAGWALNEMLDNKLHGGNAATLYLIVFSLIAGVVGVASVVLGFLSLSGTPETKAVAVTSGLVAWVLSLLALGLAAKQIHIGKVHNKRLRALEAFAIIVAADEVEDPSSSSESTGMSSSESASNVDKKPCKSAFLC